MSPVEKPVWRRRRLTSIGVNQEQCNESSLPAAHSVLESIGSPTAAADAASPPHQSVQQHRGTQTLDSVKTIAMAMQLPQRPTLPAQFLEPVVNYKKHSLDDSQGDDSGDDAESPATKRQCLLISRAHAQTKATRLSLSCATTQLQQHHSLVQDARRDRDEAVGIRESMQGVFGRFLGHGEELLGQARALERLVGRSEGGNEDDGRLSAAMTTILNVAGMAQASNPYWLGSLSTIGAVSAVVANDVPLPIDVRVRHEEAGLAACEERVEAARQKLAREEAVLEKLKTIADEVEHVFNI